MTLATTTLKIKIKTLAAESQAIRKEETKHLWAGRWNIYKQTNNGDEEMHYSHYEKLHRHRTVDVRKAARSSNLAYAYLRGTPYNVAEMPNSTIPWDLSKMIVAYIMKHEHNICYRDAIKHPDTGAFDLYMKVEEQIEYWLDGSERAVV